MGYTTQAIDMEMTPSIKEYADTRFDALNKLIDLGDDQNHLDVKLSRVTGHATGEVFKVEAHLALGGDTLYAEESTSDLYASIDAVKDELMRQLRKRKTKKMSFVRRGGRALKRMLRLRS